MIFDKLITNPADVLKIVIDSIENKNSLLLTYFNQHCFNIYYSNKNYADILNNKFKIYQADLGIYLALKSLFQKKINRIIGTDLNEMLMQELIMNNVSISIIGGKFEEKFILEESNKRNIKLVTYKSGYFELRSTEKIISELTKIKVQVYIIGMGVPRQEIFAEQLSRSLNGSVIICVGSFLEFYFGKKKRTHIFFRKTGFEWVYRLITEPSGLWKRYIFGIPLFIYRIIKIKFSRKPVI